MDASVEVVDLFFWSDHLNVVRLALGWVFGRYFTPVAQYATSSISINIIRYCCWRVGIETEKAPGRRRSNGVSSRSSHFAKIDSSSNQHRISCLLQDFNSSSRQHRISHFGRTKVNQALRIQARSNSTTHKNTHGERRATTQHEHHKNFTGKPPWLSKRNPSVTRLLPPLLDHPCKPPACPPLVKLPRRRLVLRRAGEYVAFVGHPTPSGPQNAATAKRGRTRLSVPLSPPFLLHPPRPLLPLLVPRFLSIVFGPLASW